MAQLLLDIKGLHSVFNLFYEYTIFTIDEMDFSYSSVTNINLPLLSLSLLLKNETNVVPAFEITLSLFAVFLIQYFGLFHMWGYT